jgi:uncharacterized protein YmfQ (DUF2313 family)
MKSLHKTSSAIALLCLSLAASQGAAAAGATDGTMAKKSADTTAPAVAYSDRAKMTTYDSDRKALQAQLATGMDAAFYRKKLADLGYQVTAVNDREADYVEYEVVKGGNSHEVQIDFDKASRKATKVDVAMNLWRADSTKAALRGSKFKTAQTADFSDRMYLKGWTDEKDALEAALGTGHDKGYYAKKLADLGYTVTATNDREADYLEYEVVKGKRTYEVQVDFDKAMQKASSVDVTTNLWHADATDKALDSAKR